MSFEMRKRIQKLKTVSDNQHIYSDLQIIYSKPQDSMVVCKARGNDGKDWALKIYEISVEINKKTHFNCLMGDHQNQMQLKSDPFVLQSNNAFQQEDDLLIFPSEYAKATLSQVLLEKKMKMSDYFTIITQLVTGLKNIHQKDIVHGDITLNNIFVVDNNQYKFGDFGYFTLGTPHSRHIDLIRIDNEWDKNKFHDTWDVSFLLSEKFPIEPRKRWDVYSLGCLFYDMICTDDEKTSQREGHTYKKNNERFGLTDSDKQRLLNRLNQLSINNKHLKNRIYHLITCSMNTSQISKQETRKIQTIFSKLKQQFT